MKPLSRRILAVLAMAVGLFLIVSEVAGFRGGVQWFWIFVAVLMVLLGLAEFFWPAPP